MNGHAIINRLYRLVWSDAAGGWVAVAENARGRGKASGRSKLMAALFAGIGLGGGLGSGGAAWAAVPAPSANQLPTGGQVRGGAVTISQTAGQAGNQLNVTQTSQRGAVDWATFNVGSNARVDFQQPSSSAVTLNRVLDTQASQIFGHISANGQVFLSNPNGVYFSPTASVDVGGLVATTHHIDPADFMAGGNTFARDGATGSVVNDGALAASLGGYIALLAPEVRNNGIVTAQAGTVALASGEAIELQFSNNHALAGVLVSPSAIAALVENGSAVRAPGGLIVMSAQAADQLQGAVVRNTGTLEATGMATQGGKIVLGSSGLIDNSGSADVSGAQGGSIEITSDRMLSAGTLRADGIAHGGSIASKLAHGLVETASALVSATGGGSIAIDAGAGQLYTSGRYDADGLAAGQHGGSVILTADKVALMGASASASGHDGGGSVRVGGDLHGANAAIANAQVTSIGTGVKLSADATARGDGGRVVVWSDDTTSFAGAVSAKGGATGGNGGQLEVSGQGALHFNGHGDASAAHGTAGTLLLDPKNIYIDDQVSAQVEYIDPHSTGSGTFGATVTPLTTITGGTVTNNVYGGGTVTQTGYVVITNPTDTLGAANAGAAYLFRRSDQALISTLYGTHTGDSIGSTGATALANGNFVIGSPLWNSGRGAVTWGSGTTGWGAGSTVAISSSNSLTGTRATFTDSAGYAAADNVGGSSQVKALPTGNYVVDDAGWGNSVGAVAFGNGTTGSSGVISLSNALVGSTVKTQAPGGQVIYLNGDGIGGVTLLQDGNYVVADRAWNKGVGAVAFGSGTTGLRGVVSASNALVGNVSRFDSTGYGTGTDQVGTYLLILSGSKFVTYSSNWNTTNSGSAGAVTSSDGTSLPVGLVSSSNSLVGSPGDYLSSFGVTNLAANNAYLISSPSWGGGKGAATWVSASTNVKNTVVSSAGVTGTTTSDSVSSKSTQVLSDGDYVVLSPNWHAGLGAATLVDGSTGKAKVGQGGTVSSSNSLVGSATTDNVGQQGIVELAGSGDYVVVSPMWSNGGTSRVGAVTWSTGTTAATVGAVSSSNSLIGTYANDRIGEVQYNSYSGSNTPIDNQYLSVNALSNGNYVVSSPMWNGTRGAVTLGNGSTGSVGAVTSANSLVGSNVGDFVGSYSSQIQAYNGAPAYVSLSDGVQALANGNFVVMSDFWKNGSATRAGAVTWSSGTSSPTVGAVSSSNSLVGSTANDMLGYGQYGANGFTPLLAGYDGNGNQLYSSNYVIFSANWDNGSLVDAGAYSWGSGTASTTGAISNVNSIVGNEASGFSQAALTALGSTGNYVILNPQWDNGSVANAGALTFVNGSTGQVSNYAANGNTNIVGAANSLVGSATDDFAGSYVYTLYNASSATSGKVEATGNYLLVAYDWDHGSLADAGAVTWGSGSTGVTGTVSRANSIVGEKANDNVGGYITVLPTGNYVVGNPTRDIGGIANAGAATWVDGSTGRVGDYAAQGNQNIVSAANSMVGSHPDDHVGDGVYSFYDAISDYNRTGYFIFSTSWNCLAGALTYVADGSVAAFGVVDATNSAVGDPNGHFVGGLTYSPYPALVPNSTAIATFGGDGGHVYEVTPAMPATGGMAIANATQYGDAAGASQMITPDYVASVLKTGTSLTLQASNDILVKGSIDATGGTAGGALTLDAGRSIAILGDIVTGNRNLSVVANDTVAHGVHDAQRDAGVATISMGTDPLGHVATINAGTGSVSMTMSAGADKTNQMGGSISLNSVTAAGITVVDHGNGLGTVGDLPTLADCCGYTFGAQTAGADILLNTGAILHATGNGTAVSLAADGQFVNASGNAAGSIDITDPNGRWLVYANAPGTSSFAGLDSGNTAVWNEAYDPNVAVTATGNRYVFAYQPTVTVNTQSISKTYGQDLSSGTTLANQVLTISGGQAAVAGAFLGDTLSSAVSGSAVVTSAGAAAAAGAAGGPYAISINLSGLTGNNGYAVALGSNTARTLTVTPKTLTATLSGVTKAYDGNANATLTNASYVLGGLVNSDSFTVGKTSGTYNANNVTAASVSTTLASSDFTGVSGSLASNYTLPTSASGSASITPRALTATLTNVTKTYDGNTNATLSTANYTLGNLVGGQSATVTKTSGSYNFADVAQASSASTTLASGDFSAGGGTSLSNYSLPTSASGAATVSARALTTTLSGSLGKTYDGTTAETLSSANFNVTGFVGGQSATVTQTAGVFNSANVASATTVTATLSSSDYSAGNNTTLSNYTLPTSASASATISRAALTLTASNDSKTYDGTAYSGGHGVTYSGFVNNQNSSVLGGSLSYGGSAQGAVNVGSYAIVPSGYTSSNYNVSFVNGVLAIDPLVLTVVTASLIGNLDKTYDGSNTATLSNANFQLAGFVNGDSATVTKTGGTYDGANAGSHNVTVSLAGGDFTAVGSTHLNNYTLPTSATGTGVISPRAVTLTAPTVSKVYDGGLSYTTTMGNLGTLSSALVGGNTVTAATLTYANKNAGTGDRTVGLSGVTIADGNNGANYTVTLASNNASTITPRTLTVGATATNRVYDTTTAASVSLSDNRVLGDVLSVSDTAASFADKNAATNKTVTVSGIGLSGADAANYALASTTTTATANITPASLQVGGVSATGRAYNTLTGVALAGTPTVTALGNDVVAIGGSPVAVMANKNVGTAKPVTVSGYTTTNANYVLLQPQGLAVNITPAVLSLSGLTTPASRVYDTTTLSALAGTPTVTGLNDEVVTLSGTAVGHFADKNVGNGKPITVSGLVASDSNYVVGQEPGLNGTVTPASLQVTGLSTSNRVYDTTTSVSLNGTAAVAALSGDVVTLSGTGIATTANKNAGTGKAVTVTGYSIGNSNYVLVEPQNLTVEITPAALAVTGVSAVNRIYDTTTGVALSGTATVAPLGGDVVVLGGSGVATMADKNVGTGKAVSIVGYTISDTNYVLAQPQSLSVDITPAVLQLGGLGVAGAKTYDGTRVVSLIGTPSVSGLNGETVNVSGTAIGRTADKNVGIGKAVTISGLSSSDVNYTIGQEPGLHVDVTPASLQVTGLSTSSRVYDTTTSVSLNGTAAIAALSGDVVTLSGTGTATTANKNAGTGKAVTVSGYSISDPNYVLIEPQNLTVDITPALLQLSGLAAASSRIYDADTDVSLGGTPAVSGLNGETVTLSGHAVGQFADKNVGSNKAITISGLTSDDANYTVGQEPGLRASTTPATLVVSGVTAADRAYDTGTVVALNGTPTITPLGHDVVALDGTGSASVADKNAGSAKAVTVSGYTIADPNYLLVQPQGLGVNITPAVLSLDGVSVSARKTYDGTRNVALGGTPTVTGLNGELVTLAGSMVGQTADKNVGTARTVTVSGLATSDANYAIGQPALAIDVTPAALAVTGVSAVDRVYDTTTGVALSGTATVAPLGGDVVVLGGSGVATMTDKNVGTGKAVSVGGYTIGDTNYVLVQPQALSVDIAPAVLQLGGLGVAGTKTYDGTRIVSLVGAPSVSGLNGEVVNVSGTAVGQTADKNVGSARTVAISGLSSGDANYTIGQEPGLDVDVTPAHLLVTGVSAADRVYDTHTGVVLTGTATIAPLAGDVVALGGSGVASMADKNAGTAKAVNVSGYSIADGNYVLVQPQGVTVDIAPAVLQLGGLTMAADKTYDGTRNVTLGGTPTVTGLNGEVVMLSGTATGRTADKNVGANKAVTVGGLLPNDSNYAIGQQPGLVATVAPATLAVTGVSVVGKQFDGTTAATLAGAARVAPAAGDQVAVDGTPIARYADANVGLSKPVTVSGYGLVGNDAANYVLQQPSGLAGDITSPPTVPAPVVVPPPVLPTPPETAPLTVPPTAALRAPLVEPLSDPLNTPSTTLSTAPVVTAAAVTAPSAQILVSLVRTPSLQQSGQIAVSVPREIATASSGFSFAMPTVIVEAAATNRVQVVATGLGGAALPAWIHYDANSQTFVLTQVPAGGLPLQVLVTIGGQSAVVSITEQ